MSDCLFCSFVNRVISIEPVYEDDQCIAINDINPQAPVHALVIPKRHVANALECGEADEALVGHLVRVSAEVARMKGVAESGFRLVINTNRDGGQSVDHLHVHVIGGRQMNWPPG